MINAVYIFCSKAQEYIDEKRSKLLYYLWEISDIELTRAEKLHLHTAVASREPWQPQKANNLNGCTLFSGCTFNSSIKKQKIPKKHGQTTVTPRSSHGHALAWLIQRRSMHYEIQVHAMGKAWIRWVTCHSFTSSGSRIAPAFAKVTACLSGMTVRGGCTLSVRRPTSIL